MHRYSWMIFKENMTLWMPSIVTISFLSCLISLCAFHFVWVGQANFIAQALAYGLDLTEFKIISATLYFIVLALSGVSLWLIGKATTQQLLPQFAQWRLLGVTPKEIIQCNLIFSAYLAALGGICGTSLACPLSFWILPKLNAMANGYQPHMVFEYHFSFAAATGALFLSFLTCLISSGATAFLARKANPLDLFRSGTVYHLKSGRIRRILGFCCLGYTILLICMLPAIRHFNGGISAVYNLMFHVGISGMICVFIFAPTYLRFTKKLFLFFTEKVMLRMGRISIFAIYHKMERNNAALMVLTTAFTMLTIMYLGIKTIMVAVFKTTGITEVNLSDSFAIAFLVALTAVFTAFSIIILNFKNDGSELAVMKSSGLSHSQGEKFVFGQAFVFTVTVLFLSIIPILMVSLVGTLGLILIGTPSIVVGALPYVLGFIIILFFLSVVLWIPTRNILHGDWINAMRP